MSTATCRRLQCRHLHVDGVNMQTLSATCRRRHVEAMFDLWKNSLTIYVIYLINIHEPPRSIWSTEAHAPIEIGIYGPRQPIAAIGDRGHRLYMSTNVEHIQLPSTCRQDRFFVN